MLLELNTNEFKLHITLHRHAPNKTISYLLPQASGTVESNRCEQFRQALKAADLEAYEKK